MTKALFGAIDQLSYVVDDLDESIARWITHLGVGPWTVFRNVTLEGCYRGQPGTVTIDVALAYQGDIQIELVKPTSNVPSPFRDAAGSPALGIHRIAWIVDDLAAAVARATARGLTVIYEAANPAASVVYMEAPGERGLLLEVIQGAGLRELAEQGIAEARAWDGTDPVRLIN